MDRPNRPIANRYARHLMQAVEDEMGGHSLRRTLHQAGLERYLRHLPPADDQAEVFASELAQVGQVIRAYYGQGARGSLNRIGRAAWRRLFAEAPLPQKIRLYALRLIPESARCARVLETLAAKVRHPDGQITLDILDTDLIYVDRSSDFTFGQKSDEGICWTTVGMIQESLRWATGRDYDVEEISCRAMGAEACTFRIPFMTKTVH